MDHDLFSKRMKQLTVLYIEDDPSVQKLLGEFLRRYTEHLFITDSAEEGYSLYKEHHPDIMLMDINLPKMNGIELAQKIRLEDEQVRMVISTAYTNKEFLLQAVELNLERYLVKPISGDDLYHAFMKCVDSLGYSDNRVDLGYGLVYDTQKRVLLLDGESVDLRRKELRLLKYFLSNQGAVVTYDMLAQHVWSGTEMTHDAIRSQIKNLRKKTHSDLFQNISGIGYKMVLGQQDGDA